MIPDKIYTDGKSTYATLPVFSNTDGNISYIRKDALLKKLNRAIELRIKSGADKTSDGVMTLTAIIRYIESL